jgi:hypothetical protein
MNEGGDDEEHRIDVTMRVVVQDGARGDLVRRAFMEMDGSSLIASMTGALFTLAAGIDRIMAEQTTEDESRCTIALAVASDPEESPPAMRITWWTLDEIRAAKAAEERQA